ncbi:hypothetical protein ACQKII_02335 [Lysinibacillus sp. NPDC048646]|uniref:hypothetical protein n=1 Tax=Lysinibacillus sp. NPDC048646 TaxID=3390574 RepID=UPI003D001905
MFKRQRNQTLLEIRTSTIPYDSYKNLKIIKETVHKLVHATKPETIHKYMIELELSNDKLDKLNKLRELVGNEPICIHEESKIEVEQYEQLALF